VSLLGLDPGSKSVSSISAVLESFRRCPTALYTFTHESIHVDLNSVRDTWTNRAGEYSPAYYAHYGPNETSTVIRDILSGYLS